MNKSVIITKINNVVFFEGAHFGTKFSSFRPVIAHHELILHLSGKTTINFDNKIQNCEKGVLRFLPKGNYANYDVLRHEYGDCIDIFFDTDEPFFDAPVCMNFKNNVAVESLFKKAVDLWVSKSDGYYHKCLSILYDLLSEIEKQQYLPENKFRLIEPAVDFINSNFLKEKISVEHLAEISGISQSYLKKLFLQRFGVTPLKYIIQLKINYARNLLKTGFYTSSQVAEICGYANLYFFSRQFKEYCGISPMDFKTISKNKED